MRPSILFMCIGAFAFAGLGSWSCGTEGSVLANNSAGTDDGGTEGGTDPRLDGAVTDAPPGDALPHEAGPPGSWTVVPSGTTTDLYGVWGGSDTDAFAVGGTPASAALSPGVIVRWNGSAWSATPNGVNLLAVSGVGANTNARATAVGVYGGEGSDIFFNGSSWTAREVLAAGAIRGVWQNPGGGTYVAGEAGLVYTSETGIAGGWGAPIAGLPAKLNAVWRT